MKRLLLACLLGAGLQPVFAQQHHFEISKGEFRYDGQPFHVHSGEMHFARVPREYWRQRLQMMKAMGLNTVATYVFWNHQETAPGVWDWKTGNHNLREFIKLAGETGLHVILRPGPYACAEWEFGGYPWWLQKEKSLEIRTNNTAFLDSCRTYIKELMAQVKDLQVTEGGPVIMIQAENEFGSYVAQRKDIPLATHKAYSKAIKDALVANGATVPLFTSDGSWLFEGGTIEGCLPTANGEDNIANLKKVVNQYHNNEGPYMVAEFYPGWLDHWAEPFPKVSADEVAKQTEKYLKEDVSFNFYMVHGGTNFGFTTGANYDKEHPIQPDMTSYDYDAPISEAGWATPKYKAIRALLQQYSKDSLPAIPAPLPVISIPAIKLDKTEDVLAWKEKLEPVVNDNPLTFEDLNQGHGYVLYSRKFNQPINGKLHLEGLRDYALVYVNGQLVAELNRYYKKFDCDIDIPFNATLDILVENMGRINYGADIIHNTKGIISPVLIDSTAITGNWKMYKLPMDKQPAVNGNAYTAKHPVVYSGKFNLAKTGDTFLDMKKWGKGIVFVNGHNLGRYWKVGPQQTLYLPGCWLKKGINEIVVFEQLNEQKQTTLQGVTTPVLDQLVKQ